MPQLRHLAPTNLLADALILAGLAFVACYALSQLDDLEVGSGELADAAAAAATDVAPAAAAGYDGGGGGGGGATAQRFAWFQTPRSLLLYVGTTCFTFEGGGLMVPI